MTNKFEYARVGYDLSDCEDGYQQQQQPQQSFRQQRQRPRVSTLISTFLLGLVTMAAMMGTYSNFVAPQRSHARTLPPILNDTDPNTGLPMAWSHGDCGNSPQEAQALNCRYSIVLHSWLPNSCLTALDTQDAEDMYHERREWSYETASGQNLSVADLAKGDYGHFTTSFDWHVTHCMYVWKRLHRILLDPELELDSYTANYHHTSHCVDMIAGRPEGMKDSGTKIFVKYPKCAR